MPWFIAVWAVATLAARWAIDPVALPHDQALYLECAARILRGELPYAQFFDINPPLIMYFNVPPVFVARLLHLNPIPVFLAGLTALSAASGWMALRGIGRERRLDALETLALLALPLGPCALRFAASDAGQREHLFVLLYFPLLVLRVARSEGWAVPSRVAAFSLGLLAGCGLCLKPTFVLMAACAEAVFLWRRRTAAALFDPEIAGACAAAVLYGVQIALWPSAMREAYFGDLVPLAIAGYRAYDLPIDLTRAIAERAVMCAAIVMLAWRCRRDGLLRAFLAPGVALVGAGLFTVWWQHKGWRYHFMPADAVLILLAGLLAAERFRRARAAVALLLATVLLGWPVLQQRQLSQEQRFRDVVERYTDPGAPVAMLLTTALPAAVQTARPLVNRHLWPGVLVMAVRAQADGHAWAAADERRFIDETAADIERGRPAAVFIDDQPACEGCPSGFRIHDYLRADARFAAALKPYRYRGSEEGAAIYTRAEAK